MKISEIAKLTGTPISTIRYYDDLGLLCSVQRNQQQQREFSEEDVVWLKKLKKLHASGLTLGTLAQYVCISDQDKSARIKRQELLLRQKNKILADMDQLRDALSVIDDEIDSPTFFEK
ncbi:transcriptional regulator, MerR family [Pediococcus damnosus]|uniref:Transcriptional regulator, MerR family n=1 Tax=Pediococcus damnosus TaxID=51663 RepID=A0AAC9FJL0_9LACO|nr:MerR family transcriptional regulator [Pediococcus damnosus]AMV61019.1 transcriptional regulator, MerR family [Pediococcus damnosus]AMV63588.1 transcriptional regulator, MerR family [Pediococcus damnosus]AMV65379.1 transcriptional regulator, MerR family [Pediococcus damnosus]AMV66472.1 transcriptional regulator, MerR family [Pediococcus damnosus]AMV68774.1 transcriptional regulator, MerR family [Pediococcus damnosus]